MDRKTFIKNMLLVDLRRTNERATEEEKEAQVKRSKQYRIGIKKGGNVTKPSEYADIPDDSFGDPVNYKYPIDDEHLIVAIRYFNHEGQRQAGGYTAEEWEIIGNRIASRTNGRYVYKDGKIVRKGG